MPVRDTEVGQQANSRNVLLTFGVTGFAVIRLVRDFCLLRRRGGRLRAAAGTRTDSGTDGAGRARTNSGTDGLCHLHSADLSLDPFHLRGHELALHDPGSAERGRGPLRGHQRIVRVTRSK